MMDRYYVFESVPQASLGASIAYRDTFQVFQVQSWFRPWRSEVLKFKTEYMLCVEAEHPDWTTAENRLRRILEDDNERLSEPREIIDKIDIVLDTDPRRTFIPEETEPL